MYGRDEQRRERFLANHPEWQIVHVKSAGYHEASRGSTDTELVLLIDRRLTDLLDRLVKRYGTPEEVADDE